MPLRLAPMLGGLPASLLQCSDTSTMILRPEAGPTCCRLNLQGRPHKFARLNRPTVPLGMQSLSCQRRGAAMTHSRDSEEVISPVSVEPDSFRELYPWWHDSASSYVLRCDTRPNTRQRRETVEASECLLRQLKSRRGSVKFLQLNHRSSHLRRQCAERTHYAQDK